MSNTVVAVVLVFCVLVALGVVGLAVHTLRARRRTNHTAEPVTEQPLVFNPEIYVSDRLVPASELADYDNLYDLVDDKNTASNNPVRRARDRRRSSSADFPVGVPVPVESPRLPMSKLFDLEQHLHDAPNPVELEYSCLGDLPEGEPSSLFERLPDVAFLSRDVSSDELLLDSDDEFDGDDSDVSVQLSWHFEAHRSKLKIISDDFETLFNSESVIAKATTDESEHMNDDGLLFYRSWNDGTAFADARGRYDDQSGASIVRGLADDLNPSDAGRSFSAPAQMERCSRATSDFVRGASDEDYEFAFNEGQATGYDFSSDTAEDTASRKITAGSLDQKRRACAESMYAWLESMQKTLSSKNAYQQLQTDAELRERFRLVLRVMVVNEVLYARLMQSWKLQPEAIVALARLDVAHAKVMRAIEARQADNMDDSSCSQPNPFMPPVAPTSKRYLIRMLREFRVKLKSGEAFDGCVAIADELGPGVTWHEGKLKREKRIIQKALLRGNRFDEIRDFARGTFVVDDLIGLSRVVERIETGPEYAVIRAKNRFSPDFDARDTGGYRDYQLLVKLPDGFIIEIQVLPIDFFVIKHDTGRQVIPGFSDLTGHWAYKEHRAVVEAKRRNRSAAIGMRDGMTLRRCSMVSIEKMFRSESDVSVSHDLIHVRKSPEDHVAAA